ncbi:MAG TPA: cytochrome c [Acidimicrobiales bacterium]|nr:cytochrome c [Acidimicrobiales bacterium]
MTRARRRRSIAILAATIVVVGITLGACGDDAPTATPADPQLALGAEVYASACASCHGTDLRGTDQGPSHLSIVYEPGHHPDEAFRAAIDLGVPAHHWDHGPMPPIPGLSAAEVDAVIAYVRDQQQQHGFEPYPPR